MRVLRAGIAAVAVTVLVSACGDDGGSKKVDVADYVSTACGDFNDFSEALSDLVEPLNDLPLSDDSPEDELEAARDAMAEYIDGTIEQLNVLKSNLAEQGQPDTSDGSDFSKTFQEQFEKFSASLNDAKKALADFDPKEGSAEDLQTVFQDLEAAGEEESDVLDEFDEITDAFSDQCPDVFS